MEGVTKDDWKAFEELLIKANNKQLKAMIHYFQAECHKRADLKDRAENLRRLIEEY